MIIPWICNALPGPLWVRVAILLVTTALAVAGLFHFAFPWFAATFVTGDADVGGR